MKRNYGQPGHRAGFSLGEMLAVVIIGAMILTALLGIYGRVNRAAQAVLKKVEGPSLASEVLQLMAEDLGQALAADDVTVQIRNGFDNGFARAELVLRRVFHDNANKEQTLEEVTWRAGYDQEGATPGLVVYRSQEGIVPPDKLLDEQRDVWEKNYPLVPICRGVTFFQIQAYKGENLVDQWPPSAPPAGVRITLSFAEPYETVRGTWDVLDEEKTSRTIVIDAMRTIKFVLPSEPNGIGDPNEQGADEASSDAKDSDRQIPGERASDGRSSRGSSTSDRTIRERMTDGQTPRQPRPR